MQLLNKNNLNVSFAAAKEQSRYSLAAILVTEKETVATDGHVLARVSNPDVKADRFPVVAGFTPNGFTRALLPVEAAKDIEKAIPKKNTYPIVQHAAITTGADHNLQVAVTDLATPRVFTIKPTEGNFPNWEAVWPKGKPAAADVTFNAGLLKRVFDAGVKFSDRDLKTIRMRFYDANSAARFDMVNSDGQELNAVVMPVQPDSTSEPKFMPEQKAQLAPANALNVIHELLDGVEWTAETPAQIAEVLKNAGYQVKDINQK